MGGHRGGEVASQLALETIEDLFRKDEGSLVEQVRSANHAVFVQSQEDTAVSGMGTTLTAALVEGSQLQLAHVGDSRAYLLRAGSLRQLTADHTLVARMVKSGEITEAEAEVHPHRNVLTRSLGTEADVQVDEDVVGLLDGDRLLLCSDGLTGMVTEDQIKAILETEPDPQRASDRLIKAANRAGGIDNITVVVLDAIGEDDDPVGPGAGCTSLAALVIGGLVALILLVGTFFAARTFIDRQWYVGVADDKVAVYQASRPIRWGCPCRASTPSPRSPPPMPAPSSSTTTSRRGSPPTVVMMRVAIVERIRTDVADDAVPPKKPKNAGGQ
jgi:protein phosphatase